MRTEAVSLVAALAMAVAVGCEWRLSSSIAADLPPIRPGAAPVIAKVVEPARPPDALVPALLARPLFAPTRRPYVPGTATAAAVAVPDLPRVAGTILAAGTKRVVFASTGDTRSIVMSEGGEISGFHIQSIEPGRVIVVGPGGSRTLLTSFGLEQPPSTIPSPSPPNPGTVAILPASAVVSSLPDLLPPAPALGGAVPGAAALPASLPRPPGTPATMPSMSGWDGILRIPGLR